MHFFSLSLQYISLRGQELRKFSRTPFLIFDFHEENIPTGFSLQWNLLTVMLIILPLFFIFRTEISRGYYCGKKDGTIT
jgi:hypothetical protein